MERCINGVKLELDLMDIDVLEKFEDEMELVIKKTNSTEMQKYKKGSEGLRAQCDVVECFIDQVFGEGMSQKIFNGKKNIIEHLTAFGEISSMADEMRDGVKEVKDRYSPKRLENRQARRAKNNKHSHRNKEVSYQ